MKIIFYGTSDYCLPIVETLNKNFDLKLIVTRPDKPVGRKKILTPSATKVWGEKNNVPVVTPETLKKETSDRLELYNAIKKVGPFLAVVSDYGLIIPEEIFNLPKFGTINIHFSKLPDLRGPSPVQFTLLRGETEAWVTIFKLKNPPELKIKMDSGPILSQNSYPIFPDDTTQTLYTRLFKETALVLPKIIDSYAHRPDLLKDQDHSKATFCRFLSKDDGFVEWGLLQQTVQEDLLHKASLQSLPKIQQEALKTIDVIPAPEPESIKIIRIDPGSPLASGMTKCIHNFFRAMTPWPSVWTIYKEKRMIIRKCHVENDNLIIDEVQFEGKNPIPFNQLKF